MESFYDGDLSDSSRIITRHLSFPSSVRFSLSWFDIKVFYVKLSNFIVDDLAFECLSLNLIPSSLDTVLEVNGARCPIDCEGMSCILRRDRVDKKSEEATFVSTDSIRLTNSVKFEVFDNDLLVISGVLERPGANGSIGESNKVDKWIMNCEVGNSASVEFLKGKQNRGTQSSSPIIEVYVAGCFSGTPFVLTRTLKINHQKKQRKGILNSIPEYSDSDFREDDASEYNNLLVAEYKSYNYKADSEDDHDGLYWRRTEYMYGEDGELSWFNSGVRVGVGIGLGICVGVGVGIGLLVRTYQTTSRSFKRQLF